MSAKTIGEVKKMVHGWLKELRGGQYVDFGALARDHRLDIERLCSVSISTGDDEAGKLYDEFCTVLGRQTLMDYAFCDHVLSPTPRKEGC